MDETMSTEEGLSSGIICMYTGFYGSQTEMGPQEM